MVGDGRAESRRVGPTDPYARQKERRKKEREREAVAILAQAILAQERKSLKIKHPGLPAIVHKGGYAALRRLRLPRPPHEFGDFIEHGEVCR